jgi:hypothetical protein
MIINGHPIPTPLIVLGLLAVLGALAAFASGRRAAKHAVKGMREVTRMTGMAVRTLVTAAGITVVQWVLVTHAHDTRVILATLALPALFAGASIARLLAVTELVHSTRGGRR